MTVILLVAKKNASNVSWVLGPLGSICLFLLNLSIWRGSGGQGQSPYDRFSVGVKEKFVILESSASRRVPKPQCPGPCCSVAPQKPNLFQVQMEYVFPPSSLL